MAVPSSHLLRLPTPPPPHHLTNPTESLVERLYPDYRAALLSGLGLYPDYRAAPPPLCSRTPSPPWWFPRRTDDEDEWLPFFSGVSNPSSGGHPPSSQVFLTASCTHSVAERPSSSSTWPDNKWRVYSPVVLPYDIFSGKQHLYSMAERLRHSQATEESFSRLKIQQPLSSPGKQKLRPILGIFVRPTGSGE